MGRKTFTPEQIIFKLREVEIFVGQGESIAVACRKIAVTEQTYYRWRKEYGGMGTEQLKRLKELVLRPLISSIFKRPRVCRYMSTETAWPKADCSF